MDTERHGQVSRGHMLLLVVGVLFLLSDRHSFDECQRQQAIAAQRCFDDPHMQVGQNAEEETLIFLHSACTLIRCHSRRQHKRRSPLQLRKILSKKPGPPLC